MRRLKEEGQNLKRDARDLTTQLEVNMLSVEELLSPLSQEHWNMTIDIA